MAQGTTRRLIVSFAVPAVALTVMAGCEFTSKITLDNRSHHTLTPYPVVTTPAPPHREADPANNIAHGSTAEVDPHGFNPVYYAEGITDSNKANGLYLGMDVDDADPMMIQYKVFHYKVPPGAEGTDPSKQPILLKQDVKEVTDQDLRIIIRELTTPTGGTIWNVIIRAD